jgi:DNA-binding HxlR family transcriptional regulator
MARTNTYGHYCPAARTLEIVGEKWALLVVRDLLEQPQRFSDLMNSLGGITPKLLTARLRDLEAAGVIERDEQEGRRDVWYRITPTGEALTPVLRELVVWGVQFSSGPTDNERVSARSATASAVALFNSRRQFPLRPVTWEIANATPTSRRMTFDGDRWQLVPVTAELPADLRIATTPETWISLIRAEPGDAATLFVRVHLTGDAEEIARCSAFFTGQERA